jgi:S-DNA-T family DNA segregation ATPase FtsK/SpoIIIE
MRDEGSVATPTDPHLRAEAEAVRRRFRRSPGMPLLVGLDRAGQVSVLGPHRGDVVAVARALLAQVVTWHAPEDVTVAVLTAPGQAEDWAWARWLPHLLQRAEIGAGGATPLVTDDPAVLAELLADDLAARTAAAAAAHRFGAAGQVQVRTRSRLLVIDDAHGRVARTVPGLEAPAALGVTVVHLLAAQVHEPDHVGRRVRVLGTALRVEDLRGVTTAVALGVRDDLHGTAAEGLARTLAPLRLAPDSYDDGTGTPPADFRALHGFTGPPAPHWAPRPEREFLRVPLGVDTAGRPLVLDLKESAALGMGPHGLCVGATGSGKSELLRTLVLGLAATHPPDRLAFVLVDYKGGATFAPFASLPHVSGLITNLEADAALVTRMHTSLDGEIRRRQQVLADAQVTDVAEYAMRRAADPGLPPLPHLLVVIDEFGELLTAEPEFVELFLRIGRIGRSIGVHLLLSSQRIEAGKLRGLDTYLSYRIGLRTLSEAESRTVLDTPDAFALPALPGHGYLKVDVSVYTAFKTAHVSGPLPDAAPAAAPGRRPRARRLAPDGRPRARDTAPVPRSSPRTLGPTLVGEYVAALRSAAPPVAPVWLPPLPAAVALDAAAGPVRVGSDGVRLTGVPRGGGLRVPIGRLDVPERQWQGAWTVDLTAGGGHLLLVGGPGTGVSTALRTVALGLATTYTPEEVAVYGVDLTGAGLRAIEGLPHVGGVAGRDERERVRRTVDEVHTMLAEREALFARRGMDSMDEMRGTLSDVVLLLDGYGRLGPEFESLEAGVHDLIARGGRYGVHVVATARRANEVRTAQQTAFAQRIELRLTEPGESGVDGKLARALPRDSPGRALTVDRRYGQIALPRLDGVAGTEPGGVAAAVDLVRGAWSGPVPPPVRVLPAVLPAASLIVAAAPGPLALPEARRSDPLAFGRFQRDHAAAELDLFGRDQHVLVLGDSGSGRTNLLRLIADGLVRRFSATEIVFAVFDPRRGLADAVPESHLGGYAPNPTLAARLTSAVVTELARRDPGDPATIGPRVVLLVDDYDVLAASAAQPLAGFVPYVASGRDIGLHVVMTRRTMGASRGLYEPFTLAVRESGCLGLMLSGDRNEGRLLAGERPTTLPVGRAQLVRPGEPTRMVQTALLERP